MEGRSRNREAGKSHSVEKLEEKKINQERTEEDNEFQRNKNLELSEGEVISISSKDFRDHL
jgi:hypothetical protein